MKVIKNSKTWTKLGAGAVLSVAAFLLIKGERPIIRNAKTVSNQKQKEQLFI